MLRCLPPVFVTLVLTTAARKSAAVPASLSSATRIVPTPAAENNLAMIAFGTHQSAKCLLITPTGYARRSLILSSIIQGDIILPRGTLSKNEKRGQSSHPAVSPFLCRRLFSSRSDEFHSCPGRRHGDFGDRREYERTLPKEQG